MLINQETMDRMHLLQLEMLRELVRVMDILGIKYYMVHGSLLGAIRDHDFIKEDDDIDIAIFREDYNRLIVEGQSLLKSEYFLQNSVTDNFPLPFAKLRKQKTAFIQPVLKNCNCNQGIYIDIFPIDYEGRGLVFKIKRYLMENRIAEIISLERKRTALQRVKSVLVRLMYRSYDTTLLKRELLYSSQKATETVCIYGGKTSERGMPISWFGNPIEEQFCGLKVTIPRQSAEYLRRIYGDDYFSHNPAQGRFDNKLIEISAKILDFDQSYKLYY